MRAPKNRTNQRSRQLSAYVAPYVDEWVRIRAAALFPAGERPVHSSVSLYLSSLIEREMEREEAAAELPSADREWLASLIKHEAHEPAADDGGYLRRLIRRAVEEEGAAPAPDPDA